MNGEIAVRSENGGGQGGGVAPVAPSWSWGRIAASALVLALAYLLAQMLGLTAALLAALASGRATDVATWVDGVGSDGLALALATMASALVCVPLSRRLAGRAEAHPWRFIGLVPVSARACALPFAALLLLLAVFELGEHLLGRPSVHPFVAEVYASAGSFALLAAAMVIGAPLAEEVPFRGFLFAALRQRCGAWTSAVATSLPWTLLHIQYDAFDLSYIFLLGMLLAWARARTGSLLAPLAMHAFVNLLVFVLLAAQG